MPLPPGPSTPDDSKDSPPDIESLFHEALALPREERGPFLDDKCGLHFSARDQILALLAAHEQSADFMPEEAPLTPEIERELARHKPEETGDRIGSYKLLQQIGEGGFGTVWMAEQEQPVRRRVALKILKLGMDTREVIARFEQERQALALMDHPNIAQVFDAGATQYGRPFFVMELVRGIRITDYCDQANLSTEDRLRLCMAVCNAVHHAHQKGVIHRDLKPSNILVTLHDGIPVPKVIDFGVAKATQSRLTDKTLFTQFEQMIGTPLYMSPEQAELSGLDVDTRSDVYALGVLLYELLTGQTPFSHDELLKVGLDEMRRVIRECEPRKPSTVVQTLAAGTAATVASQRHTEPPRLIGQLRGDLDWIVMKCLEKDRTRRYDSASALMHDIERHLRSEPVSARPPSALYRLQKFARRNKTAFAATIAVTVSLVGGIVVSSWLAYRAYRAEDVALEKTDATSKALGEASAQRDRAATLLSVSQAERGQRLLEQGDVRGLLHLVEARRTVEHLPEVRDARTRLWHGSYSSLPRTIVKTFDPGEGASTIAFSPASDRIYIGSYDKSVKVYDLAKDELTDSLALDGGLVWSAKISPNGKYAFVANDNLIEWWEVPAGAAAKRLRTWTKGAEPFGLSANHRWLIHTSEIVEKDRFNQATGTDTKLVDLKQSTSRALGEVGALIRKDKLCVVSDDGRWLASAGVDSLRLISLDTEAPPVVHEIRKPGEAPVHVDDLIFTPDDRWLFQYSTTDGLRRYDTTTGAAAGAWRCRGVGAILSPDGKVLLHHPDSTLRLIDTATGEPEGEPITLNESSFVSAAFSKDSAIIATGLMNGVVALWDGHTGKPKGEFSREPGSVTDLQFSDDGRWLAVACSDGQVRLRAVENANTRALPTHRWPQTRALSTEHTGTLLVATQGRMEWRELATGKPIPIAQLTGETIMAGATNRDGSFVATMSTKDQKTGTLRWWKTGAGEKPLTELPGIVCLALAFSADGHRLAAVDAESGAVRVWEIATQREILNMPLPAPMETTWVGLRWSPDSRWIATRNGIQSWILWDVAAGKALPESEEMLTGISPDWRFAIGFDGVVDISNPREMRPVSEPGGEIGTAAFSPDGKLVSFGGRDGMIRIWETATGTLHGPVMRGHMPMHIEFTPDGHTLVTTGRGGLRYWDPTTGLAIGNARRSQDVAFDFSITPDSLFVVVNHGDAVDVWPLPRNSATLTEMERATWLHTGSRLGAAGDFESIPAAELNSHAK